MLFRQSNSVCGHVKVEATEGMLAVSAACSTAFMPTGPTAKLLHSALPTQQRHKLHMYHFWHDRSEADEL